MAVTNAGYEPEHGPLTDLLRLQTEFQLRVAEETTRYLRAVQDALSPVAPTSVLTVSAEEMIRADSRPGADLTLESELENTQAVHVAVTAGLTPLVSTAGTTWFPTAHPSPTVLLLAPGERATIRLEVVVPPELPAGEYHGALVLPGFRADGLPVLVAVDDTELRKPPAGAAKRSAAKAPKETDAPAASSA